MHKITPTPILASRTPFAKILPMLASGIIALGGASAATPPVDGKFVPADVDFEHPVYLSNFANPQSVKDWVLEGGRAIELVDGKLVLKNGKGPDGLESPKPLVCWLKTEVPADFMLEFTINPRNRKEGLAIVFFNARGLKGESVFDPSLAPRKGEFKLYHSGDINNYHTSYWSGGTRVRDSGPGSPPTSHIRKNVGFAHVATGKDLVESGPEGQFQTVRIYKRGGAIRVIVDDLIAVSYDDDGKAYGPVIDQSGWLALRQMPHTGYATYGKVAVYPLK